MKIKIKKSADKQYYALIVAGNGANLFWTESYVQKADAKHAAELVKAYAAGAAIEDEAA